ncbi:MAG: 4Fe-4S binding protein, partial [Calditrichales bacterium]
MKSHSSSPSQPFITSIFILILLPVSLLYAAPEEVDKVSQFFNFLLLPRVWVSLILSLAGLALLMRFKVKKNLRLLFMFLTFFVFAIFPSLPLGSITVGMGLHPSPVCTTTKPFLFMNAGRDVPMIFLSILFSILVLSIIGNKLFCGWACPIGALQEIFNRIPIPEKLRIKLPFRYTNAFRTVVYIAYIPLVFLTGIGIYDFFNPFETLHWPPALYGGIVLGITVIASLFIYRP